MIRFDSTRDKKDQSFVPALLTYGVALLLLLAYVNTYEIWRLLETKFGPAAASLAPFAVTGLTVAATVALARRLRQWNWMKVAVAAAVALLALFLADPAFPAKRIHVPQYILLAMVLRRAVSYSAMRDPWLTVTAVATAALMGVHDEFLQGFHPERSFGLRDIGINTLGALAGGLLSKGIRLHDTGPERDPRPDKHTAIVMCSLAAAVLALIVPMESFRTQPIPLWTVLPLLAACCIRALLPLPQRFRILPMRAFLGLFLALIAYPPLSHAYYFN